VHSHPTNKSQNISTLTDTHPHTLKEQYKRHKSPLLEIPKESKVRIGFKYVPRELCSSKVWKQVEEEWKPAG